MDTEIKMPKVKLKVDDEVIVIAGKDKGKRGKVMFLDRAKNRVVVQGINTALRFQRPTQENQQGGRIQLEHPLHLSNVAYYDSKSKNGRRLGYRIEREKGNKKGKKMRALREKGTLREIREKEKES